MNTEISQTLFTFKSLCLIPLTVRTFFTGLTGISRCNLKRRLHPSLPEQPLQGPALQWMGAHGATVKVVLRVSVLKELPVWHCGQPRTGNTQAAERQAVKVEALEGGPTGHF